MPDPTAAERAREVIWRALWHHTKERQAPTAEILDALLANPSLLAALAVEAGGVEQFAECGHCVGHEVCRFDESQMLPYTVKCEPVYRRVEGERDV